jgi:tRNA (adenine22-N1)-methyltransferase
MLKISKRLEALDSLVNDDYEQIWDCCCDHGILGMNLLARMAAPTIHFVDVVPSLISSLEAKLKTHFPVNNENILSWQTHCADATDLAINAYPGKQLVIIAGVGGDMTLRIVKALYDTLEASNKLANVDFLLCPVRQHYRLRCGLYNKGFKVKREILVEENKRIYEILLLSADPDITELKTITPTGDRIWLDDNNPMNGTAQKYGEILLEHYSKMAESGRADALDALRAYKKTIQIRRPD